MKILYIHIILVNIFKMSKEKIKILEKLGNSQPKSHLILNIKKFREEKNITQRQLAELTWISYQTITKIEIWVIKEPGVYSCLKMAKVFWVSVEELVWEI